MNMRPQLIEEPEVNLTPLIDVVFLLLIFFMVSTTFNRETELKIELPEASSKASEHDKRPLELIINRDGKYFIAKQEVVNTELKTLIQALRKTVGDNTDVALLISADAKTAHESVVRAMDAAGQLGITHIIIATKKTASDDEEE